MKDVQTDGKHLELFQNSKTKLGILSIQNKYCGKIFFAVYFK